MITPLTNSFLTNPVPLQLSLHLCSHGCMYCFSILNNPKQAFEKLDKQYVERKKALSDYNAKDDEYTIATEILYKRLGRKLPKNK